MSYFPTAEERERAAIDGARKYAPETVEDLKIARDITRPPEERLAAWKRIDDVLIATVGQLRQEFGEDPVVLSATIYRRARDNTAEFDMEDRLLHARETYNHMFNQLAGWNQKKQNSMASAPLESQGR